MTTTIVVDFASENVSKPNNYKQAIDIPDAWSTITAIEQFNTFSGQWDATDITLFTQTPTTHTVQALSVNI